jgi:hypothetical protein
MLDGGKLYFAGRKEVVEIPPGVEELSLQARTRLTEDNLGDLLCQQLPDEGAEVF